MLQITSQNLDRSRQKYLQLMNKISQQFNDQPHLAVLTQDAPKTILTQDTSSLPRQFSRYKLQLTKGNVETVLVSDINTDFCVVSETHHLGNAVAAGLMIEISLLEPTHQSRDHKFYLTNVYIRPRAGYNETKQLLDEIRQKCDGKFSRLIIIGDLNSSSALWDPMNLRVVDRARQTRAVYYSTKIIRGNLIERFMNKHNLKNLLQTDHKTVRPTYVNTDQERPTEAWIDLVLVGSKADRIWQAIKINEDDDPSSTEQNTSNNRGHRAITTLCTERHYKKTTGKTTARPLIRYRPEKMIKEDLLELRLRTAKMRNNWARCNRDEQIDRLERLTNLTMATIKNLQEIKARTVIIANRNNTRGQANGNIGKTVKRLHALKARKIPKHFRGRPTLAILKGLQNKPTKIIKTRAKLMSRLRKRMQTNHLEL